MTYNQACRANHGAHSYGDNDSCYCDSGYDFNENDICVRESESPQPTNEPGGQTIEGPDDIFAERRNELRNRGISDEDALALFQLLLGAEPEDRRQQLDSLINWLAAAAERARTEEQLARIARARITLKEADAALNLALEKDSIKDPKMLEATKERYKDSWLMNPLDKKTNMMMSILERQQGHDSAADAFHSFAWLSLTKPERDALLAFAETAKLDTLGDIFHAREAERAQAEKALRDSSFMHRLGEEFDDLAVSAQETTKDACYKVSVCDWVWQKKVAIMTTAEKLSEKVSDLMNDPIKTIFGVDRNKIIKGLEGQQSTNGQ